MSEHSTWLFFSAERPEIPIRVLVSNQMAYKLDSADPKVWNSFIDYVEDIINAE